MSDNLRQLYESSEIDTCLRINFKSHWQDVKQDIFEKLVSLPDTRLAEIRNLRHYIVQMIINLKRCKYDRLRKQYIDYEPLPDIEQTPAEQYTEEQYHEQLSRVKSLDWYHKGVLELYVELGSVRAVSEKIKIPYDSIKLAIKEARQQCRQEY